MTASGAWRSRELEDLFREHHRLVFRTAYSITGSVEDAEDVLQTIFMRLAQRETAVEFRSCAEAYFYRSAVNLSLTVVRSRKRRGFAPEEEAAEVPARPSGHQEDGPMQRLLLDAVAQLPQKVVEVLILHYVQGYSDAEVAKLLGKSRGVVAVTLYRARARLKKLILQSVSGGTR